jgi:hypothetical protein
VFARVAMYEQIDVENWGPVAKWFEEHGEELNQRLAGYQGSMTLLDRENARMFGIGLYDTAANAREVDATMDQGPPSEMPEELREILMRGTRPHRGVYEVVQGDGRLSASS